MFYIGSTSLTGSDSDCASRCSNVSTAWLLDTWPSSVDLSPASTDTGIYDLLAVASLMFHELDCQHTEDVRSVMLDRLLGTLFLSVSTTMHFVSFFFCHVKYDHGLDHPLQSGRQCSTLARRR